MLELEAKYGFKKTYQINSRLSKKSILFRDITTLIKNPEAFRFANDKIIELSKKIEFDKVSAIESRGFVFASTVSYVLNKPFILLRKKTSFQQKHTR